MTYFKHQLIEQQPHKCQPQTQVRDPWSQGQPILSRKKYNSIIIVFFLNMFTTLCLSSESWKTLSWGPVESRKAEKLIPMWQGYDAKIDPSQQCWKMLEWSPWMAGFFFSKFIFIYIIYFSLGLAILFQADEMPLWSRVHRKCLAVLQ
jgi:hypothetical protein